MVGGGNSAGQAAVFLAESTKRVHMLVRSAGLVESMSRYLIRRIEDNPKIVLRTHTEIVNLKGDSHLESVRWRNSKTGQTEEHPIRNVFVMAGAARTPTGSMAVSLLTPKALSRRVLNCRQKTVI